MSNNIFKSQKPPKKNNNNNNNNNNKNHNKNKNKNNNNKTNQPEFKYKTELFEIKDTDFPALEQQTPHEEKNNKEKLELNFKDASLKEKENINNDNFIPNGWTVFRMVDGKIIVDGDLNNRIKEKNSIEDYHSIANKTFNKLIDDWENSKIKYDQLHGFGEYDRVHKIPIPFNENNHIHNDDFSEQEENDNYEDNAFGYGHDDDYENYN
jgi:hypothetical protein